MPIEGEEGFPFITKIYNYEEGEIKINEVIEVIGIICLPEIKTRKTNEISQPFFSQAHGEDAAYYFEEFILSHIPVLHSISYRKFDYNSNPLLFPFYSPFPNLSFGLFYLFIIYLFLFIYLLFIYFIFIYFNYLFYLFILF